MSDDRDDMRSLQDVLTCVLNERGGRGNFNTAQLLAARGLCRVLGSINEGDLSKAASIATLEQMLPPRAESAAASEGPWDLSLLTDRQLRLLERLSDIAHGLKPATPPHRAKTSTYWGAVEAAQVIDQVCGRGSNAQTMTDAERIAVKNAVVAMLSALGVTVRTFFAEHLAPVTPSPDVLPSLTQPPSDQAPASSPQADNVVPLHSRSDLSIGGGRVHPCLDSRKDGWPVW